LATLYIGSHKKCGYDVSRGGETAVLPPPCIRAMTNRVSQETYPTVATLDDLAKLANYSLIDNLNCDADAKENGADYEPRQVFTGHYVPVNPTPIKDPEYVAHSKNFFHELGFADDNSNSACSTSCCNGVCVVRRLRFIEGPHKGPQCSACSSCSP
jgi:hypothetical protein